MKFTSAHSSRYTITPRLIASCFRDTWSSSRLDGLQAANTFWDSTFLIINSCVTFFYVKVKPVAPDKLGEGDYLGKLSLKNFLSVGQNQTELRNFATKFLLKTCSRIGGSVWGTEKEPISVFSILTKCKSKTNNSQQDNKINSNKSNFDLSFLLIYFILIYLFHQ